MSTETETQQELFLNEYKEEVAETIITTSQNDLPLQNDREEIPPGSEKKEIILSPRNPEIFGDNVFLVYDPNAIDELLPEGLECPW